MSAGVERAEGLMGRIRSIKPEFPQSETTGALSRDARLLFIQLWTIVDDEGRARAASRMLASLLYPYDDDARDLIDGWLAELEANDCIRRYVVDGSSYLEIVNWLKHQKIDHASKSRLPAYSDDLAKPREPSRSLAPDLGPRTMDKDLGSVEAVADATRPNESRSSRLSDDWVPTQDDLQFARARGLSSAEIDTEGIKFRNYWTAKAGKDATKRNWGRTWQNWILNSRGANGQTSRDRSRDDFRAALGKLERFGEGETRGGEGGAAVQSLPAPGRGGP